LSVRKRGLNKDLRRAERGRFSFRKKNDPCIRGPRIKKRPLEKEPTGKKAAFREEEKKNFPSPAQGEN